MGRLQQGTLGDFTAVAVGTAVDISKLEDSQALVLGTFVGTVAIEISTDGGTTWVPFDTATAPKVVTLPDVGKVRANCTAFTSGTIKVRYGGRDADRGDL